MPETITQTPLTQPAPPPPPVDPPPVDPFDEGEGPPERPKLKKLRLASVLLGLGFIAFISTVFGMMMAVAGDVPNLEDEARFKHAENSILVADDKGGDDEEGTRLARLADANQIFLSENEISPYIKNAVISIEDKRFFEHRGVDYRGIARALWADVSSGSAKQGASTITQQFVKNALAAQGDRSVFQKLREAATAYHLERKWSKQKILTQYLNSVYFGNGAYGIESAMRTYFGEMNGHLDDNGDPVVDPVSGEPHDFDEKPEAAVATPAQAAMLAGVIASPSAYDPLQNTTSAIRRRNLVLDRMLEQQMITQAQYAEAVGSTDEIPDASGVNPPQPDSTEPYFTTWVTQQAVTEWGPERAFGGGMKIKTTLDPEMQAAAETAVSQITGIGPSASLVTIENATGEVKAMVGGSDFEERPFNLATNGHRQPGSAIKTFTLLAALRTGDYGAGSTFVSTPKVIPYREPNGKKDIFVAENYEDSYAGTISLSTATIRSDNAVFAELGMKVGTKKIAKTAEEMGIKTKLSTNPSMTLGGLKEGVTPLEMAFAYSTLANNGRRVCRKWASYTCGPVAIDSVEGMEKPQVKTKEVFSKEIADLAKSMLSGVVTIGTGKQAQVGEFAAGKTGTTENYGDAWFCGFITEYTTCVWVGYVDKVQPMLTEYGGSEVAGGTWPAIIWRVFMNQAIALRDQRAAEKAAEEAGDDYVAPVAPTAPVAPEGEGGPAEPAPAEPVEPTEPVAPVEPVEPTQPPPEPAPPPQEPALPPSDPPEGGGIEPEQIE